MVGVTQVSSTNSLLRRSEVTRCLMIMKSPVFSLCQHFTFLTTTSCISWWKIASNGHNFLPSLDSCPGNVSFVASFKKGVLILGPGLCLALNMNRHEALTDLQGACTMGPWTLIRPRHGPPHCKMGHVAQFPFLPQLALSRHSEAQSLTSDSQMIPAESGLSSHQNCPAESAQTTDLQNHGLYSNAVESPCLEGFVSWQKVTDTCVRR